MARQIHLMWGNRCTVVYEGAIPHQGDIVDVFVDGDSVLSGTVQRVTDTRSSMTAEGPQTIVKVRMLDGEAGDEQDIVG